MKTALVTGGNRGIGKEICRQLAQNGFFVILTARDAEKGKAVKTELSDAGKVEFVPLDVSDPFSIRDCAEKLTAELSQLDVLVNNAAIMTGSTSITDPNAINDLEMSIPTNVLGPLRLTQALLPLLQRSEDARVINLSSRMGSWSDLDGRYTGYRLTKTMLNASTVMLSVALKDSSVNVFSMCPGWVKTDMGGPNAMKDVAEGADTAFWLATSPVPESGYFYAERKVIPW